ncbi:MAG: membrane protein insertion efficiency factor YidD [Spirochaetaceae bacterium]|jgi:putative membrane protein insertion efficiency factor|nr:membrane protein insertion efficiency factor YidD [Spirochaetaceae bacterium]
MAKIVERIVIGALWLYQTGISPYKGGACCRFYPSCSAYTVEAVQVHGVVRGLFLAIKRLLRCHPFSQGGYDPVPGKTAIEVTWKKRQF